MSARHRPSKPDWKNPIDEDLDAIRDNFHFLACTCAGGALVLPGWNTEVTATDYAEPSIITLSRGTKKIQIVYTWNSDGSVKTVSTQYKTGVDNGGYIFSGSTIAYDSDGNFLSAT